MASTPKSSSSTPLSGSTPQPQFPTTPSPHPSSSSASKPAKASSRPKAANVFTNDGSFLERFQRSKKEEEEKKKLEEDAMRKRNFEDRFKNRGKRPAPDTSVSNAIDDHLSKKVKVERERDKERDTEKPLTQYEKEVKSYAGRSLKDDGIGIRPLVK
ncbi:hypothetical protein JB92DRAFT_3098070 [Gautieria morchelliformis]|nr:hypothetical protein JB92DRAFT_3098070 [Gautieria morchelliformis]